MHCMEPVFTVAHDYVPPVVPPAPQPHQPGHMEEGRGRRCWRWRWRRGVSRSAVVALLLVFLAVTAAFALAVYRARRSPRDLAFVIVAYYLLAFLACCVAKLEQLRRRDNAPVVVAERRRVRIAVWAVSVALGNTFASRVADAVPGLALKLAVWGVTAIVLGIALYLLFFSKDAERFGAELGRGHAGAGHRQATASHGVSSPEERV